MLYSKKIMSVCLIILFAFAFIALNNSDLFTRESTVPKYNGKEDHSITLPEAASLVHNFQNQAEPNAVIGGYFGGEAVLNILNQEGAVGLRYYYGMDNGGTPHIVLVGVDADGNDMMEGLLAERAAACPPFCGEMNEFNPPQTLAKYSANF